MVVKKTRNTFEKKIERQLKKAKVNFTYESARIPYLISGHYVPDFIIDTPTGKIFIETKGYFRREAKAKMVAVKKTNPQLDIRLLFYSDRKSDIRWAIKNGFPYAVDTIPQEWLDGF